MTVEHAFESFDSEDSELLGLAQEIAPIVPAPVPPAPPPPTTVPTALLAPNWPESKGSPAPVDIGAPDLKVSAAIALLVGWVVALTMAGVAFLSEGPRLLPAMKSAIVPPASPPPPVIQTHRTEDIHLPSPQPTRAKKSR